MIRLAMASSGVEKARLDYDQATGELVVSIVAAGQVKHIRIPTAVTFSIEEISAWLAGEDPFADPAGADPPAQTAQTL